MHRSTFPPWHRLRQRARACTSWLLWREWRGRRVTSHSPRRRRVAAIKALRTARQRLSSKWSKRSAPAFPGPLVLSKPAVATFHNSFLFQPTSARPHNSGLYIGIFENRKRMFMTHWHSADQVCFTIRTWRLWLLDFMHWTLCRWHANKEVKN